jgi:hypothetical protein
MNGWAILLLTHRPAPLRRTADFAYEVPAALVIGQTVSAYHKRAKLLSRGSILTADYEQSIFRVQFERPELGSELCPVSTEARGCGRPPCLLIKV